MKQLENRRAAFTLAEVLVVLAIVALLAALLLGVFGRVRENGRSTTCLSNQKQILLALQLYQEDAAGHFPLRDPPFRTVEWIDALLAYAKSPAVFVCPSDAGIEHLRLYGFLVVAANGEKHPTVPSSYIASEELLWDRANISGKPGQKPQIPPLAWSQVKSPSTTVFLSDGVKSATPQPPYWTDENGSCDVANTVAALNYILRDPADSKGDGTSCESFAPNPRHKGRANVGFVDGHVKSLNLAQWYFPGTPYLDPSRGG